MTKISIIMPIYNDADVVDKSIGSVIDQTIDDIELICVNDGSSDDSLEKLNEYSEKYDFIKVFSQENQGSGKARNYGMSLAEGEYIGFLDADDFFIDNDALEKLYETAVSNDANMVTGNILHDVDNQGDFVPFKHLEYFTQEKTILPEQYGIPWAFYKSIYKKDFLFENGIEFPDLLRGQDVVFMAEILKKVDKIYAVPCEVYAYVYYDAINRCNTYEKLHDQLVHYKKVLGFLDAPKFKLASFEFMQAFVWFMDNLSIDELKTALKIINHIFDDDSKILRYVKGYFYRKYYNDPLREELSEFDLKANRPIITIISRVYNCGQDVWSYFNNILNQTFYDFELIIMNEGSKDASMRYLRHMTEVDYRVSLVENEPAHNGLAWKKALEMAQGEYILFHNPNYNFSIYALEELYKNSIANDSDFVMFRIDESLHTGFDDFLKYDFDEIFEGVNFNEFTFIYEDIREHVLNSVLSPWFKFYKKEFLEAHDGMCLDMENPLNYILLHIKSLLVAKRISFTPVKINFFDYELGDNRNVKISDVIGILNEIKVFLNNENQYDEFDGDYRILVLNILYKYMSYFNSRDYYNLSREIILQLDLDMDKLPFNLFKKYDLIVNSKSFEEFRFKNEWVSSSTTPEEYELIDQLNVLYVEKSNLIRKNDDLKKDIGKKKRFNQDLFKSSSWKLTKPLRKINNN